MKLTVIGCGYLGATHAACMAELGHQVLGMDADMDKIATLNCGKAPFFERGLDELLAKHTATGRLRFTASYAEAADFADLHFLGVGTPQRHAALWSYDTRSFTQPEHLAGLRRWMMKEKQYADQASVLDQVSGRSLWKQLASQGHRPNQAAARSLGARPPRSI